MQATNQLSIYGMRPGVNDVPNSYNLYILCLGGIALLQRAILAIFPIYSTLHNSIARPSESVAYNLRIVYSILLMQDRKHHTEKIWSITSFFNVSPKSKKGWEFPKRGGACTTNKSYKCNLQILNVIPRFQMFRSHALTGTNS